MDNLGFYDNALEAELGKNGIYASVTKGVSMRPLFKTNRDMVILKRPDTEPRKYDVVLYKSPDGRFVLHRIVRVLPDKFIIRGDNTYAPEHVPKGWVIAVLTEFNRKGKRMAVTDFGYILYSRLWTALYPLRYLARRALNLTIKIKRKIFHKK